MMINPKRGLMKQNSYNSEDFFHTNNKFILRTRNGVYCGDQWNIVQATIEKMCLVGKCMFTRYAFNHCLYQHWNMTRVL